MSRCQRSGCCGARGATSGAAFAASTASGNAGVNAARNTTDPNGAFFEDMPMCRYVNTIPICPGDGDVEAGILAALACQNQLLADILGALNALTAAVENLSSNGDS
ncbi:MAG: hypothetical protein H6Q60_142 [Oscillospiraceae bacterium]|nr:hypothetical protein [Oscillospiraceae bacterium]